MTLKAKTMHHIWVHGTEIIELSQKMKFCGSHDAMDQLTIIIIIFTSKNHARFIPSYRVGLHNSEKKKFGLVFLEKNLLSPLKLSSILISNGICRLHVIECLSIGLGISRFQDSYT